MTEHEKPDTAGPAAPTISPTSTLHGETTEEIEKAPATANHNADGSHSSSSPSSFHSSSHEDEQEDIALDKEEATAIEATRTKSEPEYIAGVKLYSLLAAQTLVFFLVMVDMSIVATVSFSFFFHFFLNGMLITIR